MTERSSTTPVRLLAPNPGGGSRDQQATSDALYLIEERFRLMIEAVRDYAIFMLDPQGHIVSWNKGAQRLKGYTADEIRGKHFSIFYSEEDRQRGHPQEELAQAMAEGSYAEEGWRYRKDGTRFWASVLITALHDTRGQLYGFGKVTRDLTERKKAEDDARRLAEAEAVRETAETLQKAANAFASAMTSDDVADAVFQNVLPALDADGGSLAVRIPDTDRLRLAWAHGYSAKSLRNYREFSIRDPTPHGDAAREHRPIFLETKAAIRRAYPKAATGAHEVLISVPLMIRGRCIGVMGASYRELKTLTAARRTLALAFADQCALALDRALMFENEVAAKTRAKFLAEAGDLFSRSLDYEVVLSDLAKLAVPALGDWCAIEIADGETTRLAAVAHSEPAKVELAHELRRRYPPRPDSSVFRVMSTQKAELHVEVREDMLQASVRNPAELEQYRQLGIRSVLIAPLIARDKPFGAVTLVWAESDRHYTPADLEFVSDLCDRAALAFENAHLYQELQKAVRVRDDFLSIAGHEVRTPLAALQLHLQATLRSLMKDPELQGHTRMLERLKKALDNGERLERLVAEVLDVSRITAGRLTLEPQELELSALVDDAIAALADTAARAGSELRFRRKTPVNGHWDRARLEQVVSNLLTNALKYGPGEPIEIELARNGSYAILVVRDFGIGIQPEDQARIFERFERAVSDKHYGGLGLGLWIARQVIEASGGTISVESTPGHGSTFTVRIPVNKAIEERCLEPS